MAKGFRKNKKETKNELIEKNDTLIEKFGKQLENTLKLSNQNRTMFSQAVQRLQEEQTAMINLLRTTESNEAVAEGDKVQIDYVGRLLNDDGSAGDLFEGNYGLGFVVTIGSGSLVPGFEDSLIGMKAGDNKTIELTFPEKYVEALKNKKAKFVVRVGKVYKIPASDNFITELHEQWVKEATPATTPKEVETTSEV